jgi:hypothetical protein
MGQELERAKQLERAREQLVKAAELLSNNAVLHWGFSDTQVLMAVEHLKLAIAEIDAALKGDVPD